MVGTGEGAMTPQKAQQARASHASRPVNWLLAILMTLILAAAIAGVVVALSNGMPTVAILIALVTGAVFAGMVC